MNVYFLFNDVVIDEKRPFLSWNVKHMTLSKWQSLTAQYKVIFTRWCDAIKSNHRDEVSFTIFDDINLLKKIFHSFKRWFLDTTPYTID